jgi:uncharacterized protein
MTKNEEEALVAYIRSLPKGRGSIEVTDEDLRERMRRDNQANPNMSDQEAARKYNLLQAEQLIRNARRAGFLAPDSWPLPRGSKGK